MVDVSAKDVTERVASAKVTVKLNKEAFNAIVENKIKKGDVLAIANVAGINAAKKTSELIPLNRGEGSAAPDDLGATGREQTRATVDHVEPRAHEQRADGAESVLLSSHGAARIEEQVGGEIQHRRGGHEQRDPDPTLARQARGFRGRTVFGHGAEAPASRRAQPERN